MFEKDLVVLERNRVLAFVLSFLLVASLIMQVASLDAGVWLLMSSSLALGAAGGLSFGVWFGNFGGPKRIRRVIASRDGVSVDGQPLVRPSQIKSARFVPGRKGPMVTVSGEYGLPLFLAQVADQAEGLRFLHAIGHDAGSRKDRFRAQLVAKTWQLFAFTQAYLAGVTAVSLPLMMLVHPSKAVIMLMTWLGMVPLLYVLLRGVTVEIGVDGVLISRPRRKEWIAFADVRSIEAHEGSARFVLADRHVDVAITTNSPIGYIAKQDAVALDSFLFRAREALAAHRATIGPRELAETLRRADREKDEWVDALRRLRDGDAAYRSAPIRDEELWRVVEDPGAPEDARAAAAFVLRRPGQTDASATTRLRVAAQAVAAPRLRIALESDDEAALTAFCIEPSRAEAAARARE